VTDCFRLAPIREHESWAYSVTRKAVFIFANNEFEARRQISSTLYNHEAMQPIPTPYGKIIPALSPWELDFVTSCEVYTSNKPGYANHVWADDGEKWPTKY
jgi:hypothetical protein